MKKLILIFNFIFLTSLLISCGGSQFAKYDIPHNVIVKENLNDKGIYIADIITDLDYDLIHNSWTLTLNNTDLNLAEERMIVYEFTSKNKCSDTYNQIKEKTYGTDLTLGYKNKLLFLTTSGVEDSILKDIFDVELYNFNYLYNDIILEKKVINKKIYEQHFVKIIDNYQEFKQLVYNFDSEIYPDINIDNFNEFKFIAIQLIYPYNNSYTGSIESLYIKDNQLIITKNEYNFSEEEDVILPASTENVNTDNSSYLYLFKVSKNIEFDSYEFVVPKSIFISKLL